MKRILGSNRRFAPTSDGTTSNRILISLLAAIIFTILTFGIRAHSKGLVIVPDNGVTSQTMALVRPPLLAPQTAADMIEGELITIRPTGFWPARIARPQGVFLLLVENRSGLKTVDLILEDQTRRSIFAARMPVVKPDLGSRFDLAPGTYALREANHPDWSCSITIEKK